MLMAGWWSAAAAHRNGIPRPIQLQGRLVICASDRQSHAVSPNSLPVDMVLGEAETKTETETETETERHQGTGYPLYLPGRRRR